MSLNNEHLSRALRKIPLWQGLSDRELEAVFLKCTAVQAVTNQVLFKEDDPSHDFYILLSGKVDIVTRLKGTVHTVRENETFGEIGMITQSTRSATALCTAPSTMLRINNFDFNAILTAEPRICVAMLRNITSSLSQHIIRMNQNKSEYMPSDEN